MGEVILESLESFVEGKRYKGDSMPTDIVYLHVKSAF